MMLHEVHQGIHRRRRPKRVGRGPGSGCGKTCGRGHKGQKSRSGFSQRVGFEGGQMPLARRIPKRGFHNRFAKVVATVNVGQLERLFQDGDEVNPDTLRQRNLAKGRYDVLKILGDGQLTKKLKVAAHRFSKSAVEKIQAAGGQIEIIPGPTPVSEKQKKAQTGAES